MKTTYSMWFGCRAILAFCLTLAWLPASHAEIYELTDAGAQMIGAPLAVIAKQEDTFIDIGRANNLGYEELRLANPEVDPWLPGAGSEVVLPKQFVLPQAEQRGVIINIAEYRLYYYFEQDGKKFVATWPASVGRMDWETPLGLTRIVAKSENPSWYPPDSVRAEHAAEGGTLPRVVPPGPDNPLGAYALRLGLPGYLIHGTNKPAGVGMRVTHGCIRLFPEDIEWLFSQATLKTPVRIVNQSFKFGWVGDELFLEVHPMLSGAESSASMTAATRAYIAATPEGVSAELDWDLVARLAARPTGLPVKVGQRAIAVAEADPIVSAAISDSVAD
jgi:L,D-transpeptidase ErfK/SrfK